MDVTNQDINNLKSFCRNLIRGFEHLDADDLVQDTIINLIEAGGTKFLIHEAKKELSHVVTIARQRFVSASFKPTSKQHKLQTTFYPCKVCRESLPSTAFSVDKRPEKVYVKLICKKCAYKIVVDRMKKDADSRRKYNERLRKWRHGNPEKAKKMRTASEAYNKENLTDSWCRKYIRHKYSKEHIDANPHLLEEVRQRLLLKRNKA